MQGIKFLYGCPITSYVVWVCQIPYSLLHLCTKRSSRFRVSFSLKNKMNVKSNIVWWYYIVTLVCVSDILFTTVFFCVPRVWYYLEREAVDTRRHLSWWVMLRRDLADHLLQEHTCVILPAYIGVPSVFFLL